MPLRLGALRLLGVALIAVLDPLRAEPLRVGIETNNEPISFQLPDGRTSGFAYDLIQAIAEKSDFTVVPVTGPWIDIYQRFNTGEIDALASIAYTEERAQTIDFSVSILSLKGEAFVGRDRPMPRTLADLRALRIATPRGGFTHDYLVRQGLAEHLVFVTSLGRALDLVQSGECDVVVGTGPLARNFIREHGLQGVVPAEVELPNLVYRIQIGVPAGQRARLAAINEGLARIRADGTYARIYEKWIGPLEPRPMRLEDLRPYLFPAVGVLAAIVAAFLWQRRLNRRLARQADVARASEERLTLVLEGSEDGFWDWDLLTGRIARSPRWASMLGYTLSEIEPTLAGTTKLIHRDDHEASDSLEALRHPNGPARLSVEMRLRAKSGEWRWVLNRCKVVARAPDGSPLRISGTHTDITDLKHAQELLTRQEAQFRFIYEHAPVGLSWLGRGDGSTRLVNPAHERITGVPESRSQDTQNYVDASHPDDREKQRILQERLYRGEISHFSIEKRYLHSDGAIVWSMLTMHVHRDPVTHAAQEVTTLVDITDLKQAEEEREKLRLKMLETQKLESLGVLAGGIAHDFNNLLTVILANASFLRTSTGDPAAHTEQVALIETAAHRASDLCRQMLAYAGKGSFVVERVNLSNFVRDTAHLLQVSINKKARLTLALAPDLPLVEADAAQLQQIVMNLVINASEALGDSSGEITLTTRRGRPDVNSGGLVHSFELPPGDSVCLEVSDTGQGMDGATLRRIFDPFFTTKFTGRGLGLAAVLGIVRSRHGALTVDSTLGHGTTFRLFLPPVVTAPIPPAPAVATPPVRRAPPGPQGTILIADDERIVLNTSGALLRRAGFQTVLANDGHEALRLYKEAPESFTAVLLDLTMPGLDGAEVLREIRRINPAAPVLIMSGYSEQDVLNRLAGLGPILTVHKPFTLDTLLSKLTETINKRTS